jgi:hypothetical protein
VVPSSPTVPPSFAPNYNDRIEIHGRLVVKSVTSTQCTDVCREVLLEVVFSVSSQPQECKIVSVSRVLVRSSSSKLRAVILSVDLYETDSGNSFEVNFFDKYVMRDYPAYNTSFIATQKTDAITESVEDGSFQTILRDVASQKNVTELMNATCAIVDLDTIIIVSDDGGSSGYYPYSKGPLLSIGAIAGITVGCFVAGVVAFLLVLRYFEAKKDPRSSLELEILPPDDADRNLSTEVPEPLPVHALTQNEIQLDPDEVHIDRVDSSPDPYEV